MYGVSGYCGEGTIGLCDGTSVWSAGEFVLIDGGPDDDLPEGAIEGISTFAQLLSYG